MHPTDIIKGRYSTYQLKDVIGKGGNAVVYSAIDSITQKTVAIKRMMAADESTLHRWRTEVEALILLREQGGNSQYVVAYLDHMQVGKAIMLVEEYAPNGSLLGLLRRRDNNNGRGLEESRVMAYMYQITRGLAYIHSMGIVHRDLKCANVLLFEDGRLLKLSDFGLAAGGPPPQSLTAADAEVDGGMSAGKGDEEGVLGSIYWMAPEIACGKPHSRSSDVWSLGCLCVELLTGRPPFFDREPVNALYCIAEGHVSPMPKDPPLSDDCRSFLQECFDTDPDRRSTAAKLVQHRWFSELRIDDRLAELAALSRSVGSREASAAVVGNTESIGTAHSITGIATPNVLSANGSTREPWSPSASFSHVRSGASSPPANVAATAGGGDGGLSTDGLGQVVEHALFSKPAAQCEQWLQQQGLKHVVDSLDDVIPGEAYNVLRIIAFAAKSREAKHRLVPNCLGETNLWQRPALLQPTTRADLAVIFSCCCERQSPDVPRYTPCDIQALHFLLNPGNPNETDGVNRTADSTAVGAAQSAIQALHGLFVRALPVAEPAPTTTTGVAAEGVAVTAAHRAQAMQVFVVGGGFEEVRRVVERQCERSLRTTAEPPLGWPAVSQLLEVLAAVEAGVSSLAEVSGGEMPSDAALVAATACCLLWGSHIAARLYGEHALHTVPTAAGLAGGSIPGGAASGHAASANVRSPNSGALAPPQAPPAVGGAATGDVGALTNSHAAGAESDGPVRPETGVPVVATAVVERYTTGAAAVLPPTVRWFLGLQYASRSHHCPPAIPLFLRYAELCVFTSAPSLEEVGRWLSRSVLLLASYQAECPAIRLRALEVLAGLAQSSAAARVALRDGDVVVPIMTLLLRHPPPADGGHKMVVTVVQSLCTVDARWAALALAASSPLVAAVVTVLHGALELAGLVPGGGHESNGDEDTASVGHTPYARSEAAVAQGRYPLEEITICLALLSQAVTSANTVVGGAGATTTGGATAPEGGAVSWLSDPAVTSVLMMDLRALQQRLPTDNAHVLAALRGPVQSVFAELVKDMERHTG